jgi:hypothetical protein
VSQPERLDEVRVSEYAGRVVRRWYVVVACIVVAVLLVVLSSSQNGQRYQAQTTVFVGQPLTPTESGPITSTVVSNPTSASAFVRSTRTMQKAASTAGVTLTALRNATSVTILSATSVTKLTGGNANVQLVVLGQQGWSRLQVQRVANSLAQSLIGWANIYQRTKASLLSKQITFDTTSMNNLQLTLERAKTALDQVSSSGLSATDKASREAPLLATIADAGSRFDEIAQSRTTYQLYLAASTTVEAAGYVQQPSITRVTASSRRSSIIVAAFAGLIIGVLLALVWETFRRRQMR